MHSLRVFLGTLVVATHTSSTPIAPGGSSESSQYVPRSLQESKHLRPVYEKRDVPQFPYGQPDNGQGRGGPISGIPDDQMQ